MKWHQRDWILLLALILLAAALRFYKLGEVPPGFQFDEAFNAIDAEQIWHGNRPLFLPANGGREAFYSYYQALLGTLFGFHIYSLRLASALAGIATVPAAYWLLRTLLQRHSHSIAFFTSLTLALSFWHLHFSHYGIRVIMMPLILSILFGCYWLALHAQRTGIQHWALLTSGLLTGLTVWTHPSGRFVPLILLAYTGWLLWRHPQQRRLTLSSPLGVLVVTGVIAFLVFLPLGVEFYRHPDFFFGHASEVSVFAERVSGDAPWLELLRNLGRVLGMFNFHGDIEWAHNLVGRPVFDPLLSLPFFVGVVLWALRLVHHRQDDPDIDALILLANWTLVMLLPSVLSEAAPNYSRTLPALPAAFVTVGLGLQWIAERIQQWGNAQTASRLPGWSGALVGGLLLAISGVWASYDYFVRFPAHPQSYYAYDADKVDALAALDALAVQGYKVYLQPLWGDHATFTFLRDNVVVKSLDTAETLVLPPIGQGAVYAFPSERRNQAVHLAEQWPGVGVEEVRDAYATPLLALVRVDASLLDDWPSAFQPTQKTEVHFDDGPTLLGMQQQPDSSVITLFWRAEQFTPRNLTVFLHLLDGEGRRVAQVDKLPGNGSYQTPTWSPGERVIEHYQPEGVDPCAGGEQVDVVVGWYELAANGERRPRLDGEGDSVVAGQMVLPFQYYSHSELAIPNPIDLSLQPDLQVVGYQTQTDPLRLGAPATFDLYWRGGAVRQGDEVKLQLLVGDARLDLWQGPITSGATLPQDGGDMICRRMHVQLPATLIAGNYQLELATAKARVTLTTVVIQPIETQTDAK